MKRIFSLLLVAVFCLILMPTVGLATGNRETNEMYAHEYNTDMLLYFSKNGYPDHYGGAYLNQITGNLIINLIESSPEIEDFYYEITNASVLEFETVKYSFKELMDALYEVPAALNSTKSSPKITGGALIQKDNKIELYVDSDSLVEYSLDNYVKQADNTARPIGIHQGTTRGTSEEVYGIYPLCISAFNIHQDHGIIPGY